MIGLAVLFEIVDTVLLMVVVVVVALVVVTVVMVVVVTVVIVVGTEVLVSTMLVTDCYPQWVLNKVNLVAPLEECTGPSVLGKFAMTVL